MKFENLFSRIKPPKRKFPTICEHAKAIEALIEVETTDGEWIEPTAEGQENALTGEQAEEVISAETEEKPKKQKKAKAEDSETETKKESKGKSKKAVNPKNKMSIVI